MISVYVKITGVPQLESKFTNMLSSAPNMIARISSLVGMEAHKYIVSKMPVLTGDALRGTMVNFRPAKQMAVFQILFTAKDRERGHPYIHFMEYGRPAIHGKMSPKMRFWRTTALGKSNPLGERGSLVFATDVKQSKNYMGSGFIRPAVTAAIIRHPRVASQEVSKWLGR